MKSRLTVERVGELLVDLADDLYVRDRSIQEKGWSSFLVYLNSYEDYPYDDYDIKETIEDEVFRCKRELTKSLSLFRDNPAYKRQQAASKRYEEKKNPIDRYATSFNRNYVLKRKQKDTAVLAWLNRVHMQFEDERKRELSRMGNPCLDEMRVTDERIFPDLCQKILGSLLAQAGYSSQKNFLGPNFITYAKPIVDGFYLCFVVDKKALKKTVDVYFGRPSNLFVFFGLYSEPGRFEEDFRMSFDSSLLFPVTRYPFQNPYGSFVSPKELELCLRANVEMFFIIGPQIREKIYAALSG